MQVGEFLEFVKETKEESTYNTYYYVLKSFAKYIGKEVDELTLKDFSILVLERYTAKLKPKTANTFIAAVRSYVNFLKKSSESDEEYYKYARFLDRMSGSVTYKKVPKIVEKKALTMEELTELVRILREDKELLYNVVVFLFYLGARPVEISQEFKEGTIDFQSKKAVRMIDFENKLISIITAKTGDQRVIPLDDTIIPFAEAWYNGLDEILSWSRPREWITSKLTYRHKKGKIPFTVTAKTARRTFETIMSMKPFKVYKKDVPRDVFVEYWIGHTVDISHYYKDYTFLVKDLNKYFVPNHYMREILSSVD